MMGSPYFSPGLADAVRATMNAVMGFSYTLVPLTRPSTYDGWGRRPSTPGTPLTGLPCRYINEVRLVVDQGGRVISFAPSPTPGGDEPVAEVLMVPHDAAILVGDQVKDITRADGVLAYAGPFDVEAEIVGDSFGLVYQRTFVLRGPITERPIG